MNTFDTTVSLVKLSVTLYLFFYGIGQLLFGILSDSFGRRSILLYGLFFFTLFSLIAGVANNIYLFLSMRIMQGLSASITSVVTKSIITDKFKKKKLEIVSNYKVLAQILSLIIAPIIGGYIDVTVGWKWNFILLTLYSLLSLSIAISFLEETLKYKTPFIFNKIAKNIKDVCSNNSFLFLIVNIAILYAIVGLFGILGSFFVQKNLHYSSFIYGIIALFCGLFYMLGSVLSRNLLNKKALIYSCILFVLFASILIISAFNNFNCMTGIILPILFIMMASGVVLPKLMSKGLGFFRKNAGTANAFLGAFVMLVSGAILGTTSLVHVNGAMPMSIFYFVLCIVVCLLTIKNLIN